MKRKILTAIKQKVCRHEYVFVECDRVRCSGYFDENFFLYRCRKCGVGRKISTIKVRKEIDYVDPFEAMEYPVEKLVLPRDYDEKGDEIIESKRASYIVAKYYNEQGILLTAYGNKKKFESGGSFI